MKDNKAKIFKEIEVIKGLISSHFVNVVIKVGHN